MAGRWCGTPCADTDRFVPNALMDAQMYDTRKFMLHLQYVHNTYGRATVAHFMEDWKPVGQRLWAEMLHIGLVYEDIDGHIQVTDRGVRATRP